MSTSSEELTPLKRALLAIDQLQVRLERAERSAREPVAVVGLGCRFPGDADGPAAFWELLRSGSEAISDVPADRWDADAYFHPDPDHPGTMSTRRGAFLRDVRGFEPQFFGISPREAASMDPQQRLLLEVAWEALEHAGIAPDGLGGSRTGVFVGITGSDYAQMQMQRGGLEGLDAYHASGTAHSIASGRLSYVLGLQGPSLTLDTACSSSLVAIHLAVQSLRLGECRLALAGGANLILAPENSITLSKFHMLAPDGRCKTFDAAADGFVRGEGCGVVVLKLLRDALADGDRVLAVVRGSAVNQDGASSGLTAPNGPAQERVIRDALANGGVVPADVDYVETHGTGTALGDPIEVQALAAVYGPDRPADRPLQIGSVKTNVGHLESVAGVAGFVKVVLALQHATIPPHLNLVTPNPFIEWDELPVTIPTSPTPWPEGRARLAGVSAFGFSGTNAHVVLEAAPAPVPSPEAPRRPAAHLLVLSGRTASSARATAARWADALAADGTRLDEVCAAASLGRAHLAHRAGFVADAVPGLRQALERFAAGEVTAAVAAGEVRRVDPPRLGMLFSGQGSQWSGMGRALYAAEPAFRAALDRCAAEWERTTTAAPGLLDVVWGGEPGLDDTAFTQPALFAVEWALAELWASWGVSPSVVAGHSVGEFVAATVAGVMTPETGLHLVATRGRLMSALPAGGTMVAVFAAEAEVAEAIGRLSAERQDRVGIAAVNGAAHTVVSGDGAAVDAVVAALAPGTRTTRLVVSHAFHSPLMRPAVDDFAAAVATVELRPPVKRIVSLVTGRLVDRELLEPEYWAQHILAPVRYADGVDAMRAAGTEVFLEAGPHPVLVGMSTTDGVPDGEVWVGSLRRDRDDHTQCLRSLAAVHVAGVPVDWTRVRAAGAGAARAALPTTPFERQPHWIAAAPARRPGAPPAANPVLGHRLASPLDTVTFEAELEPGGLPVLDDHRVLGATILPAAAFVEAALSAAAAVTGRAELADLVIQEALRAGGAPTRVQTIVHAPRTPSNGATLEIFSQREGGSWTRHVGASIPAAARDAEPGVDALESIRARCTGEVTADEHYALLLSQGLDFGPSLRSVRHIRVGEREAVADIAVPPAAGGTFGTHPSLLDAGLQALGALVGEVDAAYLPVAIEHIVRLGALGSEGTAHVVLRGERAASGAAAPAPETLTADVTWRDTSGRAQVVLSGLVLKRADRAALRRAGGSAGAPAFTVDWVAAPPSTPAGDGADLPSGARHWLIVTDEGGVGRSLVEEIRARGGTAQTIPGDVTADRATLAAALAELPRTEADVVVHLAALDPPEPAGAPVRARLRPALGGALHLVQALSASGPPSRVCFVTRGAQPAGGTAPDPDQAALWGFARTVAIELPHLRPVSVDLDPSPVTLGGADLLDVLLADDGEDQMALRAGTRFVARAAVATDHGVAGAPLELGFDRRGTIDELTVRPTARRVPAASEVEIQVHAAGINFKDVLNLLGMYPGDPGPLGSECAGTVVALGDAVTDLRVGDAVVALASGSLREFVTCDAALVVRKPAGLSFAEAAGLLIAHVTARFALQSVAGLRRGERVLVHAGAGGVGLAAIGSAQAIGAEVFATAGSPRKRALLRRLGVEHVYDSRTLDFADELLADTDGAGVDVVLNSLAGEFVPRSIDVLGPAGRFVEIGKRDLLDGPLPGGRTYTVVDWADTLRDDPVVIREIVRGIVADVAAGTLLRLPVRAHHLADAQAAFRHMAQGRHVGKVVITMPSERRHLPPPVRPDATYLITGGLGGLGRLTARHLAARGARHLVLMGRRSPAPAAEQAIEELRAGGVEITVVAGDVADAADVERVVAGLRAGDRPLRGIVHAAGVLDDGAIDRLDWDRMATVLAPKVDGLANLERATAGQPLDFIVAYSSIAAVLGAPGQANYAAANAALDAAAHRRSADGTATVSIGWGAWREAGAAADRGLLDAGAAQGLVPMDTDEALAGFDRALALGLPQLAVAPVDWPRLLARYGAITPPWLSTMGGPGGATAPAGPAVDPTVGEDMRRRLAAAPAGRRRTILLDLVREQTAHVLALEPADVGDSTPLSELGLDSLMTVELRNLLGALLALREPLPATLVFDHPSVAAIADHLVTVVGAGDADPAGAAVDEAAAGPPPDGAARSGGLVASLLDDIDDLSDEEIEAMLARRSDS